MQQEYTYAVARIRYRESRLLTDSDLSGLLASKDAAAVMRLLRDKGWGDHAADPDPEALLRAEEDKLWRFVDEIVPERSVFDFLLVPNDFHNMKVAIKSITRDMSPEGLLIRTCTVDPGLLYDAVKRRDYAALPPVLGETAKQAMTVLLETSDGQLCDVIIDKACMQHVYALGKANENEVIRRYCELFVAAADIKLAVRCAKTGKKLDFIRRALAPCDSLDIGRLAQAASLGQEDIVHYLAQTAYKDAVEALQRSMSAFEKWCDDSLTRSLQSEKWEPFTIGPVIAYILARQNEIKAVRMILSAKVNALPEDMIKERLRMMYV